MMTNRRQFLQAALAASALVGASGFGNWARLAAQQRLTQDDLLRFDAFGNVTLIHVTDIHAQLKPVWFREPEFNLGVGAVRGLPPHITGRDFLRTFGIEAGSADAYALTHDDFGALARSYGRMGGMDRVATLVNAIRASVPGRLCLMGAIHGTALTPACNRAGRTWSMP
jgi:S-sulfosulfanyl-L-cysteine sulfohydrolase